ncbi:response regulator [Christiangramia salexigens]|uniref:Response regulator n=1 Tax=Christiangramia salexigens TaxID=1913577 RepID=A0A1L3J5K5_9FLAO|nr:response regulator [Christiangramia salexigens]APG60417.1 response regulator [Christiangramia salexigens]
MKREVWVIDDDEIYQMVIKKMILRSDGFDEFKLFNSAVKVAEELNSTKPNIPQVILLDINMPLMDGWQFLELLKNSYKKFFEKSDIYIVSSSIAYSDKKRMEEFPELKGFITKPVSLKKIKEIGESLNKKNPVD